MDNASRSSRQKKGPVLALRHRRSEMFYQIEDPRPVTGIISISEKLFVLVIAKFAALVMVWLSSDFPESVHDILPGGVVGYAGFPRQERHR